MAIKLPVITKGVTLTELPGEVAVYFEIGNCTLNCRGCHSGHLRTRIHKDLYTDLEDMVAHCVAEKDRGATAIVLMGGTTNNFCPHVIGQVVDRLSEILPVGLYSGLPNNCMFHSHLRNNTRLQWLKTGEYLAYRGGLNTPGTNQLFMQRDGFQWVDKTSQFQK